MLTMGFVDKRLQECKGDLFIYFCFGIEHGGQQLSIEIKNKNELKVDIVAPGAPDHGPRP